MKNTNVANIQGWQLKAALMSTAAKNGQKDYTADQPAISYQQLSGL